MTAAPWEQRSLQLTRVRSAGTGAGVTVAVVDTGVSAAAPALAGRVTVSGGAGADCVGHGTFVAGLVAAAPVAGVSFAGVAPGVRILAVRGTDGRGAATVATVARGIRAAVDGGAGVVVVSPALTEDSAGLRAAVGYAARHDTLIVAAAVPDGSRAASRASHRSGPPASNSACATAHPAVDTHHAAKRGDSGGSVRTQSSRVRTAAGPDCLSSGSTPTARLSAGSRAPTGEAGTRASSASVTAPARSPVLTRTAERITYSWGMT
ncbi:S8 family serine peptidase [Streptomyces sp. NPDC090106]|uniref:S8 family serine peptidase n=1 Tax=Streptomyces sp. NPDC090106 TaxID=3365946 RepID=UPI00382155F2